MEIEKLKQTKGKYPHQTSNADYGFLNPMHLTEFIEQRFKNTLDSVLEVGFSEITDIAGFDCQNLRVLRLHANQITSVDDFDCKHLIELELDANHIRSLDNFNCKTLKVFSLCENRITSIENFDCKNLVDINLSENEITSIENFDCKNLKELYLSANPIKSIHSFNPKNLEYLNLDYCEIDYVAPEVEEKLLKILSPVNDVNGKWGEKLEKMRESNRTMASNVLGNKNVKKRPYEQSPLSHSQGQHDVIANVVVLR